MARILIIDDDPGIRKTLRRHLLKKGYETTEAENGELGIDMIERNPPDLILLDIMMPILDGYETCQRVKSNPVNKEIPIIFMTAKSDIEDIVKGFKFGAVDYVTKPFNLEELFVRIDNHLRLKKAREELFQSVMEQKKLLHTLCHDIMNPLGHVEATLQLIQQKPETTDFLMKSLLISVRNGIGIINLIREMNSLEEKGLDLEQVDLKAAFDEALEIVSYQYKNKEITIESNIPDSLLVIAERISLINSVINNLTSNAIKFSYPGSTIRISCVPEENSVVLSIKDEGMGMSKHLMDRIFDNTEKTSRSGTRGERGTGFGLPLVKKYIEQYGGTISVNSTSEEDNAENHGTEFKIRLKTR
ncbi:hybrid sensor histidine kinase/response regulator [bacterium]|nr:hybrid sensor histidine kinase/response regulator [bacterium]